MKYSIFLVAFFLAFASMAFSQKPVIAEVPQSATPSKAPEAPKPVLEKSKADLSLITKLAGSSECSKYRFKDRGRAPLGYIKGMALVYAKAYCERETVANKYIAQPPFNIDWSDALSWYNSNFNALNMSNLAGGIDTHRHVYTLLIGLGMRESSGRYCCGRDMSADYTSASGAEAGLFQTSYNSKSKYIDGKLTKSEILLDIYDRYKNGKSKCYLETFQEGIDQKRCEKESEIWGVGEGTNFQKLSKSCPAFTAEYGAVMLRWSGGKKGHYGPLRLKKAEILPQCNSMLLEIQKLVDANPELCDAL